MLETAIMCKNIHLAQGNFKMENVEVEVRKGCITGLVGRNGSGKTTLIRLLAGAKSYTSGSVAIGGISLEENIDEVRKKAVFVFDKPNFSLAAKPDVLAEVIKGIEPKFDMEYYKNKMELFSLDGSQKVKSYSRGMQKKLMLILALARKPEILVLDEPTSEVDPVSRVEMLDVLQEFMEDEEHTLLFSTHITSDLDKIADYIVIMDQGEILCSEEKEALCERFSNHGRLPSVEEIMCSILK
ncbi:MAG: ABC transporter ATP-binding protein [Clostridiaceae bacterium]|nr:ABC transporter ATP-binding protein [Clostridiaceae bacterium]